MIQLITIVSIAPLRANPSHKAEMVSQLLFGETCEVLDTQKDFVLVKCSYDGYEGWCQRSQLAETNSELNILGFAADYTSEVLINGESCIVPHAAGIFAGKLLEGNLEVLPLASNFHLPSVADDKPMLINAFAYRYLNTPYLWGGKSVFGVDCSGFAQQVFKMAGIRLPRDAWQQANNGETVEFLQAARLGDLAFFDNDEGKIIHVGILLNEYEVIHSSGYVHKDRIDNEGIIHHLTGTRTHRLRIIKRFF